jgi:hypothetical protein
MTTIALRVASGAIYLDSKMPDWHERINVSQLDMHSTSNCVLGQLFGGYWNGLKAVGISTDAKDETAADLGFDYYGLKPIENQAQLMTEAWAKIVRARQKAEKSDEKALQAD